MKFITDNKKIITKVLIPLVVVAFIITGFVYNDNSKEVIETNNQTSEKVISENMDMGSSSRKMSDLSDDKTDSFDIVDKMESQKAAENNQGFESLMKSSVSKTSDNIEQESAQASMIRKQLEELQRNKVSTPSNNGNVERKAINNRSSTVQEGTSKREEKENKREFISNAEDEFEDFFSNSDKISSYRNTSSDVGTNKTSTVEFVSVVNYDQTIKNKSRVELLIDENITINGQEFPKNTHIYGNCSFTNSRLNITVLKINETPVSLTAYDYQDGLKGLYVDPENLGTELKKEGGEDLVDEIDVNGIPVGRTVKNIFRKKQRESQVNLLNNYKIVLKSN